MPHDVKKILTANQFVTNYRRMWPFVRPIWFWALLSVLICIPIGSLDAAIALFLKPYTDIVVVGKDMSSPWYIPLLIVTFTFVQGLLNYAATFLSVWVGGKLTMSLKKRLYEKLVCFDPAYFDKSTSGEIIYRYNTDADTACAGLLTNLKNFITRIFSSIALIGVLFYNSWQLSIVAIIILFVAVAPLVRVKKLIKGLVSKNTMSLTALNTTYNETFAGNKTICSYNLEDYQKQKFFGLLESVFDLTVAMTRRTAWLSPFMHFVISIGLGLAVALGSWLIVNGTITSGNFVSFITALLMLYTPLKNISGNVVAVQYSFMAIERIFDLLDAPLPICDRPGARDLPDIRSNIVFDNVIFEYEPERPVLKNIQLEVKVGETLALVGNSGGGKSTLVSLLPRFYDIQGGSIKIDGVDIRDITLQSLRRNIAVVFQDNFLFTGTIRDNIVLGNPDATGDDIAHALECAYLTDFVNGLPEGINTEIGERGILLSGGQKQRVAIARAFLKQAPVVVLDEATSALDNKSEEIVQQAIDNLMKDKTVFVIAHRLSTIKNANRIAVIHEGELVELGSHEELMALENGQYRRLYEMQFKNPAGPDSAEAETHKHDPAPEGGAPSPEPHQRNPSEHAGFAEKKGPEAEPGIRHATDNTPLSTSEPALSHGLHVDKL
ncbi:MAG: ABC transporter ATP-binding protein [Desulfovibrionaceae bacterium]|nr:ABC transporter ATP-binding protein [Desulfovibrionaceae bacterium]